MNIEQEIKARASKGPRVTEIDIDDAIVATYCFTADKATEDCPQHASLKLLTIAVLVLRNGFTVTGESACADPANFDAQIGHRIAIQKARDKVWPLLGYQLREQISRAQRA